MCVRTFGSSIQGSAHVCIPQEDHWMWFSLPVGGGWGCSVCGVTIATFLPPINTSVVFFLFRYGMILCWLRSQC